VLTADDIVARLVDAGMACTVRRVIAARRAGILECTRQGRAVFSVCPSSASTGKTGGNHDCR